MNIQRMLDLIALPAAPAIVAARVAPGASAPRSRVFATMLRWSCLLVLMLIVGSGGTAYAAVTVTPATGGDAIASNTAPTCQNAGWTILNLLTIAESIEGEIGLTSNNKTAQITLNAPAGFEFNPAAPVNVTLRSDGSADKNINNVADGTVTMVTPTATQISFTVSAVSQKTWSWFWFSWIHNPNTLTWSGIQVRPISSSPLAFGKITHVGNAIISGVSSDTNMGTLTEVTSVPACLPPELPCPQQPGLTCVCDNFGRASLNPSPIFGGAGDWVVSNSDDKGNPGINSTTGFLRLTENATYNAKAATVPSIFPAAGNYISVEFRHYAYGGSGADGIALTLSDSTITARPGGFGGSLGYAQRNDGVKPPGFNGGWLGVALDEFGNFQNPTEGRVLGAGAVKESVGVRGPGNGANGYRWLGGTASNPGGLAIDNGAALGPGYMYQVIVDATNYSQGKIDVRVNRDSTTKDGSNYTPLFGPFNAYGEADYAVTQGWISKLVPDYWKISFTGSTGASTNIHEIGALRVCAKEIFSLNGGSASGFSVIDEAYPAAAGSSVPAYQDFQTGDIYMKLAAKPFKLWLAALTDKGISTGYSVATNKTLAVKLVDNSDNMCGKDGARTCNAACTGKNPVESGASQNISFSSGDPGAKLSSDFTLNRAWKNLIAVVSECSNANCTGFTSTAPACSADSFSVRPGGVSVTSPNADMVKANLFKAGSSNFSLTAIATAGGYNGTLKVNNQAIQPVAPAVYLGLLAPTVFAAATPGTSSSTAIGTDFTYSDVGAIKLRGYDPAIDAGSSRSVFDGVATATECNGMTSAQCDTLVKASTWTGIDSVSTKSDCITDSYSNVKYVKAGDPANGKYGCNFGLVTDTAALGRFIPDHFDISLAGLKNRNDLSCSATSAFTYMSEPMLATFTLTAKNAGNGITQNYEDNPSQGSGLAKLNLAAPANFNLGALDGVSLTSRLIGLTSNGSWIKGVATDIPLGFTFARAAAPDGPFVPKFGLAPKDADGVTLLAYDLDIDAPSPAADHAQIASTSVRFGRLKLGNAFGSEKLALPMPLEAQYWNGVAFITNIDDSCTPLANANVVLGNYLGGLSASNMGSSHLAGLGTLAAGKGNLKLTMPSPSAVGSVDLAIKLGTGASADQSCPASMGSVTGAGLDYLQSQWCGSNFARDPRARIRFGTYKNATEMIYMREMY